MAKEFAWKNQTVTILGRTLAGCRGCTYESATEKEALHAAGKKTLSIQSGNETVTGELRLLRSEAVALNEAAKQAGYSSLKDMPVDIIVTYIPEVATTPIQTDIVVGAEFTNVPKGMNQNDKFEEITMPFLAIDLKENV
jgi:hypothetical protein